MVISWIICRIKVVEERKTEQSSTVPVTFSDLSGDKAAKKAKLFFLFIS